MQKLLRFCALLCSSILSLTHLLGQTPILKTAGYSLPTPMLVAPGQVINLYVSSETVLPSAGIQAPTVPLPTSLGGFSVTMRQGSNTYAVPLVSVAQIPSCTDTDTSLPGCLTTILTVQIPEEIAPVYSPALMSTEPPSDLSVNDNGSTSVHFSVVPLWDNIHVLTLCDLPQNVGKYAFLPSPCPAIATHGDGTMVSNAAPAEAGETVVIYAYGLGQTAPTVESGAMTPASAPRVLNAPNFGVQYDFRPNAQAAIPERSASILRPLFAGLTPGQVGLYQINVTIPGTVPPVLPCPVFFDCLGSLVGCFIQSNLTIDLAGVSSFDGAAICVQPPQ